MALSLNEQRKIVECLATLDSFNGSKIHKALEAMYDEDAIAKSTVYKWLKEFKEESEESTDDSASVVTENLKMTKLCTKIVPFLSPDQKAWRVYCCQDWIASKDFTDRVITGDESWVYESQSRSNGVIMLIVFFDSRGIVHHEFVPPGKRVNGNFYVEVLKRLQARVAHDRPNLAGDWILHHDNAPHHTSLVVREYLARALITVTDHPPHSPDLAPCDFFLFPKWKKLLQERHLSDVKAKKTATTRLLKSLKEEDFENCFQEWKQRWKKCVESGGKYVHLCELM